MKLLEEKLLKKNLNSKTSKIKSPNSNNSSISNFKLLN